LSVALNGRRRFRGALIGADDANARIRIEEGPDGAAEVPLPYDDMTDAKLVLTDELITAALRRSKSSAPEGREEEGDDKGKGDVQAHDDRNGYSGARRGRALRPRTKNKRAPRLPASKQQPDASQPEGE
jgi:ribosome maturation factor RimP